MNEFSSPWADSNPEHRRESEPAAKNFPLSRARSGQVVRVVSLPVCEKARSRLFSLGIYPGASLKVIANLFGPLIVEVRGCRVSLGYGLARKVRVNY
jgi:Fe2+ transport system protein FeoA